MRKPTRITVLALALAVVAAVLFATGIFAQAETEGIFSYTVDGGAATIVSVDASAAGEVTVPETLGGCPVREITANAFKNRSNITILTVPDCVETIGYGAFQGCNGLTKVTLPFVGANASGTTNSHFGYVFGCSYGSQYSLPSTLKTVVITGGYKIGDYAFAGCRYLSSVTLPETITAIGNYAFGYFNARCDALTSIVIPSSVTQIGNSAFYQAGLTSVTLKSGLQSIGDEAFRETKLTGVVIPDTVTSLGSGAFRECTSLIRATLPAGIVKIQERTFNYCSALQTITIPANVTAIDSYAFYGCSAMTKLTVPGSVATIGDYAFSDCTGLVQLTLEEGLSTIGANAFRNCAALRSVTIPNGTAVLGESCFYGCSGMQTLSIPGTTTVISKQAFDFCTGLTALTLREGTTSIGEFAFSSCSNLRSVSIPASVDQIGTGAFGYTPLLSEITVASGNPVYYVKNNCLIDRDLESVVCATTASVIPTDGSVSEIGAYAFSGKTAMTAITIPNTLFSIGAYAFDQCTGLVTLTVPDSVETIGYGAFQGCNGLTKITLPFVGANASGATNSHFGYVFGCSYGSQYSLPSTLKTVVITGGYKIGDYAFAGCRYLSSVTLPETITAIGNYAFGYFNARCDALTSIVIPSSVTQIGNSAFYQAELTSVTLKSGLQSIGDEAFRETKLTSVVIPDTVTSLGSGAFRECTSLIRATLPAGIVKIQERTFNYCSALQTITIPANVTAIDSYAFSGCSAMTKLTVPGSVATIGDYAFSDCTGIVNATLQDGVATIGENAFRNCTGMTKITVPRSVSSIAASAFNGRNDALKMYGYKDSYAETYAGERSIPFVYLDEPETKYTVKFVSDGTVVSETQLAAGAAIVKPADPQKTGYTFIGWTPAVPATMPTQDQTFTAVFTANKHSVTYDFLGGTADGKSSYTVENVEYGAPIPACSLTPERSGFVFAGWESAYTGTTMPDADVTYTAQWTPLGHDAIAVTQTPAKLEYAIGETLDTAGLVVTLTRADGSTADVTADCTFTGFDSATAGTKTVTVTYNGLTASFDVVVFDVDPATAMNIRITRQPDKKQYVVGEPLRTDGLQITATFSDGSTADVTDICTFSGFDSDTPGEKTVTASYRDLRATFTVEVVPNESEALIFVEPTTGVIGKTVDVAIRIHNNPGIVATRLAIGYDSSVLELTGVRNGSVITGGSFTTSQTMNTNPYVVMWNDSLAAEDYTNDDELVVLTFTVSDTAQAGETPITVTYEPTATFNSDLRFVTVKTQGGTLTLSDRIIGDADGDGILTLRDAAVIRRYLAGWDGYSVNAFNADVDGDGEVTTKDVVLIERYIAGWDVTLV